MTTGTSTPTEIIVTVAMIADSGATLLSFINAATATIIICLLLLLHCYY